MATSTPFRNLLHAANLRHGTDGFTSPPKGGVLRIFSPLKMWYMYIIKIKSNDLFRQNTTTYTIINILVWLHVSVLSYTILRPTLNSKEVLSVCAIHYGIPYVYRVCVKSIIQIFFFTVVPCVLILSKVFIYHLMHRRITLKRILKFTVKQLLHVSVQAPSLGALFGIRLSNSEQCTIHTPTRT